MCDDDSKECPYNDCPYDDRELYVPSDTLMHRIDRFIQDVRDSGQTRQFAYGSPDAALWQSLHTRATTLLDAWNDEADASEEG